MSEQLRESPPPAAGSGYIRGGGGVDLDRKRVGAVLAGVSVIILVTLALVLAIDAARQNNRIDRLHANGVPVDVTVSSCLGMASGTGITESGFQCRGSFTVGGHSYNEVVNGTADLHSPGQIIPSVTVPGDPTLLFTAASVSSMHSSLTRFVTPALLLLLALLIIAMVLWRSRTARTGG